MFREKRSFRDIIKNENRVANQAGSSAAALTVAITLLLELKVFHLEKTKAYLKAS